MSYFRKKTFGTRLVYCKDWIEEINFKVEAHGEILNMHGFCKYHHKNTWTDAPILSAIKIVKHDHEGHLSRVLTIGNIGDTP